jgi:hypothetical protein
MFRSLMTESIVELVEVLLLYKSQLTLWRNDSPPPNPMQRQKLTGTSSLVVAQIKAKMASRKRFHIITQN